MEYVINPLVGGEITKSRLKNQQFDCGGKEGELELAKYIKQFAWKNHELGIAKTFVALSVKDRNILGYYTLSASLIDFPSSIKSELKLPGYPIPVALIGKLAVQKDCKGQGIGRGLMKHAFKNVLAISQNIGIFAIRVDPSDEDARDYGMCQSLGFNA